MSPKKKESRSTADTVARERPQAYCVFQAISERSVRRHFRRGAKRLTFISYESERISGRCGREDFLSKAFAVVPRGVEGACLGNTGRNGKEGY